MEYAPKPSFTMLDAADMVHEGEEFVYVQKGEAEIKVGEDVHHLKKGDTLHFEATIPHHLRNPSAQKAELVVVLYTP